MTPEPSAAQPDAWSSTTTRSASSAATGRSSSAGCRRTCSRAVGDLGPARVEQLPGRIVLRPGRGRRRRGGARIASRRVFGVANFALAERTRAGHGRAQARGGPRHRGPALRLVPHHRAARVQDACRSRSLEMNRALGAHVLARHPTRASSLEHPELNVHVEVLPGQAFVYGGPPRRARAGCRWARAARWRRCSPAASTRRWRRGGS